MAWRKRLLIIAGVVIVAAITLYGFIPRAVEVDVATVVSAPLAVTVEQEGRTRVIDRYDISAPVAAYMRRVDARVGDPVTRGNPVLALDPLPSAVLDPRSAAQARARVEQAAAALKSAQAQAHATGASAEYAAAEQKRLSALFKAGTVSKGTLEAAQAEARRSAAADRSARFGVDVARHELQAAKTVLEYSQAKPGTPHEGITVDSPVDGVILKIIRRSEGAVAAGEPILEVGDPHSLEVIADVLSADAVRIHPGTQVAFERWGGAAPLEGRVRRVEPVGFTKISALGVEEQRVWVVSDFTSPAADWENLGDGYRVEAVFTLWRSPSVLQVPVSALFRHEDQWAAFVVRDGRAQRTLVQIGHDNGIAAEVLGGLKAGDVVITHPDDRLSDGVRVAPRASATTGK